MHPYLDLCVSSSCVSSQLQLGDVLPVSFVCVFESVALCLLSAWLCVYLSVCLCVCVSVSVSATVSVSEFVCISLSAFVSYVSVHLY